MQKKGKKLILTLAVVAVSAIFSLEAKAINFNTSDQVAIGPNLPLPRPILPPPPGTPLGSGEES